MRLAKPGFLVATCVAAYASMLPLYAQQPANTAPPPPQLETLEEGQAPDITISPPSHEESVTQKRARGGKITETRVNKGASTYYVLPNDPVGSSVRGDMESSTTRAPQWEILHFDLRRDNQAKDAAATTPAPPTTVPPPQK